MDACMWYASLNGKLQPISRPDALPRRVWRVRWAQGGVCPAVSERYNRWCRGAFAGMSNCSLYIKARRAAAERCGAFGAFGGPRAGCVRQFRSGTIEVLPRSVCRDGKLQPMSRPDALPRRVWRVRWAQGGVCPAVSERYDIEVVPRSVCRDGKLQPISRPDALPRGATIEAFAGMASCSPVMHTTCMHPWIYLENQNPKNSSGQRKNLR